MSLNTAHIDGGVLIHQGEMILLHAPQAVLSFSGSDELKKLGEKMGNAYLTSHRLIFLAKGNSQGFKSFSFPFVVLSEVDVEQPMFGANCLRGKVRAQPDGGWMGEAKFKMTFKAGGAIEFATGMMRAIQLAKQTAAQGSWNWNAPPPAYMDVMGGNAMPAPPMYYNQPANYYGWAPPAYNFPPPEAGTVYVSEAPPPYPGLGGYSQPTGYMPVPTQPPPPYSQPSAGYPPQQPYGGSNGYPQQPYPNNGYPQQPAYPNAAPGYPQQPYPNSGYPQQQPYAPAPGSTGPNAAGIYPPQYPSGPAASAPTSPTSDGRPSSNNIGGGGGSFDSAGGNSNGGFYPPPQSGGFAYANANGGGQAYVPASAPPPYAPPPMMNKKNQ